MAFIQLLKRRKFVLKLLLLLPAIYFVAYILQTPDSAQDRASISELKFQKRKKDDVIEKPLNDRSGNEKDDLKLKFLQAGVDGAQREMDHNVNILHKQERIFGNVDKMRGDEQRWKQEENAGDSASEQTEDQESSVIKIQDDQESGVHKIREDLESGVHKIREDLESGVHKIREDQESSVHKIREDQESSVHKIRDEHKDVVQIPQVPQVDFDKNAPGEMGRAVKVDRSKLTPEDQKKFDLGWKNNAYNQYVADMISLHRTLPDVRDPQCKKLKYPSDLPDTSVIICFHNEAWSVLLRTVHSVLDRSPEHLIKEIILVDDFSNMDHLSTKLDYYVAALGKVKVVRLSKREGLIRARLQGAKVASGKVLTFLDSHCECAEGWLEPQLELIHRNPATVTTPVIDAIDQETFIFQFGHGLPYVGGFHLAEMSFDWIPTRQKDLNDDNHTKPLASPTMAGGLFSIDKAYFERLGTYDAGMDIWGGENLELSFKIWMCGGTLEILPCSHVGHVFRKRSPYSWGNTGNVLKRNSIRVAEVWMDEYKKYYYERMNYNLGEFGDVTSRKELRKKLQCKSFDWYVKNVYPELFIPGEAIYSGEIRSMVLDGNGICLDASVESMGSDGLTLKTWPCHKQGGNQFWMLSKNNEIRRDEGCFDYASHLGAVKLMSCHGQKGNQMWKFTPSGQLRHVVSGKCLQLQPNNKALVVSRCAEGKVAQQWSWRYNSNRASEGT